MAKYQCIKGMADAENLNVIITQCDVVKVVKVEEGSIHVEGEAGWCEGKKLSFTPKQFTEHFKVTCITYSY